MRGPWISRAGPGIAAVAELVDQDGGPDGRTCEVGSPRCSAMSLGRGEWPCCWDSCAAAVLMAKWSSLSRRGTCVDHPWSRKYRRSSPVIVGTAKARKWEPRAGSKRSTALIKSQGGDLNQVVLGLPATERPRPTSSPTHTTLTGCVDPYPPDCHSASACTPPTVRPKAMRHPCRSRPRAAGNRH